MNRFTRAVLALQLIATGACAAEQAPAASLVRTLNTLTEDSARQIAEAARSKAAQLESGVVKGAKCKMHVWVLGRDGTPLSITQANGAWQGSADIARRKARTAWMFKLPTRKIGELSRAEQAAKGPLYMIEVSNGGLISFPGGLPIFDATGGLIGTIGVSGDTVDNDEAVAQAGVDAAKALKGGTAPLKTLTQTGAAEVLAAAVAAGARTKSGVYDAPTKMHVYVMGAEGTVLAASQADDAWPGSADIAYKKARAVWCFHFPTEVVGSFSRPEQAAKGPLYGIELSNDGLITFPGGLPINDADGSFVGAIGVSGD